MTLKKINIYSFVDDLLAGLVVFMISVPLCLGIAVASGAPPISGLIGGIIGGVIATIFGKSQLTISGPANGVAALILAATSSIDYKGLLAAFIISGIVQLILGLLKFGSISAYFPSSVINGMLCAIGIMLVVKEIPHAIGFDKSTEDDLSFLEEQSRSEIYQIQDAINSISMSTIFLTVSSIFLYFFWHKYSKTFGTQIAKLSAILIVIFYGIIYGLITKNYFQGLSIPTEHFIYLPKFNSIQEFYLSLSFPDLTMLTNLDVIKFGILISAITTMESLLTLEATEKLDPIHRLIFPNQELKVLGICNILSGLLGGLPISTVIIRTSVNINTGAKTKLSAITQSLLMFLSLFFFSEYLTYVPLASLASILIITGYNISHPSIFIDIYKRGYNYFIPFIITVASMMLFDAVKGVLIGILAGIIFIIKNNFHTAYSIFQHENSYLLRLRKDVSFLNKAPLKHTLNSIDENTSVLIDGTRADFIDLDIIELLEDFKKSAPAKNIDVEFKNIRK
jgi:MFS superfamily sulfate permease-like transporter